MYDLSATLVGHSSDVRCCCMTATGLIVTGSRDNTARVWEQNSDCDKDTPAADRWSVICQLTGHTGFVNAVASLKTTDDFPKGLIVTGGQDKVINIYCTGVAESIKQLIGHTEGVTCLSTGWHGTILSGSADSTVRVWEEMELKEVLKGHSAPVWDVAIYPGAGIYLSASGDKTIRLWRDGKQETVYKGHLDAVRKLSVLPDKTFMSCSNDGTVRHWDISGSCLNTVQLSSNFLYSLCLLPEGFAVSGEGGNLFIVKDGSLQQSIQIPAISAWCCEPLPDSDILVGGSDGVARIFSPHEGRLSPLIDREQMKEQLAAQKHSAQSVGDLQLDKLQGPEALNKPGREGQTLMINRSGTVEVYQYSGGSWQSLGVVQDAYDKNKHELDGVKYDFVINVDVEEGKPPLKLGCNKEDDPWNVAQEFINKNCLSQAYLTQIAEYIRQNTGIDNKAMEYDPNFSDPYTGGSRHVPDAGQGKSPALGTTRHFPATRVLTENIPDASKLIKKITEHNGSVNENSQLSGDELAHFEKIAKKTSEGQKLDAGDMELVAKLLSWDKSLVFPCLDLARSINKTSPDFFELQDKFNIAVTNYKADSTTCVRVALRFLVDITCQHTEYCVQNFVDFIAPAMDCLNTTDKKFVCMSLNKILHNMTCVETDQVTSRYLLDCISKLLEYIQRELTEKDKIETMQFNLLVATGNLLTKHPQIKQFVVKTLMEQFSAQKFSHKIRITANEILAMSS